LALLLRPGGFLAAQGAPLAVTCPQASHVFLLRSCRTSTWRAYHADFSYATKNILPGGAAEDCRGPAPAPPSYWIVADTTSEKDSRRCCGPGLDVSVMTGRTSTLPSASSTRSSSAPSSQASRWSVLKSRCRNPVRLMYGTACSRVRPWI